MTGGNRETSSDKNYRNIRIEKLLVWENLNSLVLLFQITNIVDDASLKLQFFDHFGSSCTLWKTLGILNFGSREVGKAVGQIRCHNNLIKESTEQK